MSFQCPQFFYGIGITEMALNYSKSKGCSQQISMPMRWRDFKDTVNCGKTPAL